MNAADLTLVVDENFTAPAIRLLRQAGRVVVSGMVDQMVIYDNKFVTWSRERVRVRPLPRSHQ